MIFSSSVKPVSPKKFHRRESARRPPRSSAQGAAPAYGIGPKLSKPPVFSLFSLNDTQFPRSNVNRKTKISERFCRPPRCRAAALTCCQNGRKLLGKKGPERESAPGPCLPSLPNKKDTCVSRLSSHRPPGGILGAKPVKRVHPESEERPCRAKEPRRQAGIRAKQGRSELPLPDEKDMCGSRP